MKSYDEYLHERAEEEQDTWYPDDPDQDDEETPEPGDDEGLTENIDRASNL